MTPDERSEDWERVAVLEWDRHGMPQTVRALTGGMPLRDNETEYVRADIHEAGRERKALVGKVRAWGRLDPSARMTMATAAGMIAAMIEKEWTT